MIGHTHSFLISLVNSGEIICAIFFFSCQRFPVQFPFIFIFTTLISRSSPIKTKHSSLSLSLLFLCTLTEKPSWLLLDAVRALPFVFPLPLRLKTHSLRGKINTPQSSPLFILWTLYLSSRHVTLENPPVLDYPWRLEVLAGYLRARARTDRCEWRGWRLFLGIALGRSVKLEPYAKVVRGSGAHLCCIIPRK